SLFLKYSGLSASFKQKEIEDLLTLLNVWCQVLDTSPKGEAIAYKAKLRYRRGKTFFQDILARIPDEVGGELFVINHHAYIVKEYSLDEDNTIEQEYASLVQKLRGIFKNAS